MCGIGETVRRSLGRLGTVASTCGVVLCCCGGLFASGASMGAEASSVQASVTEGQETVADQPGDQIQREKSMAEKQSAGRVTLGPAGITALAYCVIDHLIYAVDGSCDGLIIIDETMRLRIHVGPLGFPTVCGLTIDREGQMFAIDGQSDQLLKVDRKTGKAISIGPLGFTSVQSLACDRFNQLYGIDTLTDQLVRINKHTGNATAVAYVDAPSIFSLAFVQGKGLYGVDVASSLLYQIDVKTGACVLVSPSRERCCETHGLTAGRDGHLLAYAVRKDVLCELNTTQGTVVNEIQIRQQSVSRLISQAIPDALTTRILFGLSLMAMLVATCIQCGRIGSQYVAETWQQTRGLFANQRAQTE